MRELDKRDKMATGKKIFVKAKPRAREEKVEKRSEAIYIVSVKEPPVQGRANGAIVRVLADYFHVHRSAVKLISGHKTKNKFFEIDTI